MASRSVGEIRKEFSEELEHLLCRVHSFLGEWRATGRKAGNFEGIRQSFNTLQASAQTAGHQDISRLSHAVERLMGQYGDDQTSDYDSELTLINLLEEMYDGLTTVAGMTPGATGNHLRSLTGIVESLLPASETGAPDAPDRQEETGSCIIRSAAGSRAIENRKFSYLLDFSDELGLTRSRLVNTVEQMRRDLNALKYHVNQVRGDLQAMDTKRDEGFTASARKVNLQLDTLIRVERKLRERVSDFSGTLNQQSHYGERLRAGLIKAGMVRETMTLCRVLLVRIGAWSFAIRAAAIERAVRVTAQEFSTVDGRRTIRTNDESAPVIDLPVIDLIEKIGKVRPGVEPSRRSLVLMRFENQISAFEVNQFEGAVQAAISTPGTQLASVRGITGVTVLADGRIVPVLHPAEFLERATVRGLPEIP